MRADEDDFAEEEFEWGEADSIATGYFSSLPVGGYSVIVADPPWKFRLYSETNHAKSPDKHYKCVDLEVIKAFDVDHIAAPDCWLLLWTTAPMLEKAFEVVKAWGFTYKSRFAWRKMTVNGKIRMGCGYNVRTMHEDILLCSKGKPSISKAFPSIFDGLAREHSRKPDEFYELVESRLGGRKLDMFSRQVRPGWDNFGDEVGLFAPKTAKGAA